MALRTFFLSLFCTSPAFAICEGYTFELTSQSANYTFLQTNANGQTEEVAAPMNYSRGVWSVVSVYSEDGPVQASSSYRVICTSGRAVAELKHTASATENGHTATTNGTGQISLRLAGEPTQPVTVRVEIIRTLFPTNDAVGYATMGSYQVTVAGQPWFAKDQQTYVLQPGDSLPTITVGGSLTLTSIGQILATSTVQIWIEDCGDPERDLIPPVWDSDDDADDPDPTTCDPTNDIGDGLHMRLTTGNVWTIVPIFQTFANDGVELNFELRYDSQRAAENGPLGCG